MGRAMFTSPVVPLINRVFFALLDAPLVGRIVGRGLTKIRYVGRRSGKTVELVVGYRRSRDAIVIGVAAPRGKTWWRNFLGEGAPIELLGIDGTDRIAHATATRDERGRVTVTVRRT